nr:rod shape-determining protein [Clostridia bacterium]
YNLDKLIEKRTGIKATVAENAFEAVAEGTGRSFNNIETLKIHASSVKRR